MKFKYSEQEKKMLELAEIANIEQHYQDARDIMNLTIAATPFFAGLYAAENFGTGLVTKIGHLCNKIGLDGDQIALQINIYLDKAGIEVAEDLFQWL